MRISATEAIRGEATRQNRHPVAACPSPPTSPLPLCTDPALPLLSPNLDLPDSSGGNP